MHRSALPFADLWASSGAIHWDPQGGRVEGSQRPEQAHRAVLACANTMGTAVCPPDLRPNVPLKRSFSSREGPPHPILPRGRSPPVTPSQLAATVEVASRRPIHHRIKSITNLAHAPNTFEKHGTHARTRTHVHTQTRTYTHTHTHTQTQHTQLHTQHTQTQTQTHTIHTHTHYNHRLTHTHTQTHTNTHTHPHTHTRTHTHTHTHGHEEH